MPRGGKRDGAGRKPIGEGRALSKTITLDSDTWARAEALGEGNVSAGIREAFRRIRLRQKTQQARAAANLQEQGSQEQGRREPN